MHPKHQVALVGLADNPAAPLDVLLRLVPVSAAADRMAWRLSRDGEVPDELAGKLVATGDSSIALALGDRTARREFIERSLDRGSRVQVDDLEWYAGEGGLLGLVRHHDPKVRAALCKSWDTMPEEARARLLVDPEPQVRAAAGGHPQGKVPDELHALFLSDERTMECVAGYADLTPEVTERLLGGDEVVRAEVAGNPNLPPEFRDRVAHDESDYVRATFAHRQDVAEDERIRLIADVDDFMLFVDVSWMDELPVADRIGHLDSPLTALRHQAASGKDLPADVVARLFNHPDRHIRQMAARRRDTPGDVVERVLTEDGDIRKFQSSLAEHPNFPSDGYIRLAFHPDPMRRVLALKGPDLPEHIVIALVEDSDRHVRAEAARHSRLPVSRLVTLLRDDDLRVVEAAASNPNLPVSAMRRLLDDAGL